MEYYKAFTSISVCPHHLKQNICGTRAKYREGKKDTAVKVYTINQESVYLLISNVPAIGGAEELRALCDQYGIVDDFQPLDDYPCEDFTEAFLVKYNSFPSSRIAKRKLDDASFLGSTLHVCYAPEFETVIETSLKLQERRKYVAWKTKKGSGSSSSSTQNSSKSQAVTKSFPSSSCNESSAQAPYTYVWAGKEYTVYPNVSSVSTSSYDESAKLPKTSTSFLPRQVKPSISNDANISNKTRILNLGQKDNPRNQSGLSEVDESSYLSTISNVRSQISKVSVPNVRVSLKRKRRL